MVAKNEKICINGGVNGRMDGGDCFFFGLLAHKRIPLDTLGHYFTRSYKLASTLSMLLVSTSTSTTYDSYDIYEV